MVLPLEDDETELGVGTNDSFEPNPGGASEYPPNAEPEPVLPLPLRPREPGPAPAIFRHGAHAPYAVRWYGITALYGHFRNFIATAIASESVDSRDWMRPERPAKLLARIATELGVTGAEAFAPSLTEALQRDVWIDFVADTGDDRDVSRAVGAMLAPDYEIAVDGGTRVLPRGDVLLFGGDTAYPVASADEIFLRVVAPWNEALRAKSTRTNVRPRVILGIPGNHDWYDGLDGFARLFRRERRAMRLEKLPPPPPKKAAAASATQPPPSLEPASEQQHSQSQSHAQDPSRTTEALNAVPREVGLVAKQLHLDEVGGLARMVRDIGRNVRAFWSGTGGVKRRKRLLLRGYTAVQESSYWAFPLAPGLDLWGVDRQLGHLDYGQRRFFARRKREAPATRRMFVAPDPVIAFGELYPFGDGMLKAGGLDLERDPTLYMTGDLHHYERRVVGHSMQVIAGGGGAFLHGTRINPLPAGEAIGDLKCVYPDGPMTRRLVAQVPWKLMAGGAGLLIHAALAAIASIELTAARYGHLQLAAFLVTALLAFVLYSLAGHLRAHPRRIAATSVPFALVLGVLPMLLDLAIPRHFPIVASDTAVLLVYALLGSFVFGIFLAVACVTGLEHQQAFTVLSHPGFKHFVRMCIRTNGQVEAWTIGKDDPLAPEDPKLVDSWSWDGTKPAPEPPSPPASPLSPSPP